MMQNMNNSILDLHQLPKPNPDKQTLIINPSPQPYPTESSTHQNQPLLPTSKIPILRNENPHQPYYQPQPTPAKSPKQAAYNPMFPNFS